MTKEIKTVEQTSLTTVDNRVSIDTMLKTAIENKVDVGTMERLLAMRKELNSERAKSDFDSAMSEFQSKCPIIKKAKKVNDNEGKRLYSYAPIEKIVEVVRPILKENGFSYSIQTVTTEKAVKAICIAKHIGGHSESSEVEVPLGTKTRAMSDTQVVASALTFAKRYAFCNAFGILTGDEDNDGKTLSEEPKVDLFEKAKKMVMTCKSVVALIEYDKKVKTGKVFKDEQKDELVKMIKAKVNELESTNEKTS